MEAKFDSKFKQMMTALSAVQSARPAAQIDDRADPCASSHMPLQTPDQRRGQHTVTALLGYKKHPVRLIIDSDAVRNVLPKALSAELAIPTIPVDEAVELVSGERVGVIGKITLPTSLGGSDRAIEYSVLETGNVALLGVPALRVFSVHVDFENDAIVTREDIRIFCMR